MNHLYRDVPGLGNVAFSRHAQERLAKDGVSEETLRRVLYQDPKVDVSDSKGIIHRDGHGVRLVILLNPTPDLGAKLVKTAFRIKPQYRVQH